MKKREELIKQQELLLEVYAKVKDMLAGYPNVVNVMIGLKEKDGKLTEEGCIKIVVKEKKSESDLSSEEVIPKTIKGIPTDVIIYREEVPQGVCVRDQDSYRPIKGGIRISNVRNGSGVGGSGTLGCLAQLNSDNSWVILSNKHVLYGAAGQNNDEIGQPWVGCSWCCKTNIIAKNFANDDTLDCAIARVEGNIAIENIILEIGNIGGSGAASAVNGERVRKRGATTGYTSGTISAIDPGNGKVTVDPNTAGGPANDPGGCTNYEVGVTVFTNPGDSGSVYINDNNEIVALHYAGLISSNKSVGNDIIRIQNTLGITIKTTSSEPGVSPEYNPPDSLAASSAPAINKSDDWYRYVEKKLLESSSGRTFLEKFRQHEKEVFFLVNQQRPVTVTWQRKQGPAFLAAFGRSVKHKDFRIPEEINRVSLQNLLMSVATILEEHGSALLVDDIQKYALEIIRVSKFCHTADEYLKFIAQIHTPIESPQ